MTNENIEILSNLNLTEDYYKAIVNLFHITPGVVGVSTMNNGDMYIYGSNRTISSSISSVSCTKEIFEQLIKDKVFKVSKNDKVETEYGIVLLTDKCQELCRLFEDLYNDVKYDFKKENYLLSYMANIKGSEISLIRYHPYGDATITFVNDSQELLSQPLLEKDTGLDFNIVVGILLSEKLCKIKQVNDVHLLLYLTSYLRQRIFMRKMFDLGIIPKPDTSLRT